MWWRIYVLWARILTEIDKMVRGVWFCQEREREKKGHFIFSNIYVMDLRCYGSVCYVMLLILDCCVCVCIFYGSSWSIIINRL